MTTLALRMTRQERKRVVLNTATPAIFLALDIMAITATATGTLNLILAVTLISGLLLVMIIFVANSLRRVHNGTAGFAQEDLASLQDACVEQVVGHRREGATAVAVQPVTPAPYAGYLWATVAVKPEATTDPRAAFVRVRQRYGWALSRGTAIERAQNGTPEVQAAHWQTLDLVNESRHPRAFTRVSPGHLN